MILSSHTLDTFRAELERMVADTAAEVNVLRSLRAHEADQACVTCMNFELNGLCLALRELDQDRYEAVSFTDPVWVANHKTRD